jgi:hypothetical protein
MLTRTINLGTVAAGASGSQFGIADVKDATVIVGGTFTGTWTVQLSYDGTNFVTYASGTAGAIVPTQTAGTERLPRAGFIKCTLGAGSGSAVFSLAGNDVTQGG